jgi:hypothetical protein
LISSAIGDQRAPTPAVPPPGPRPPYPAAPGRVPRPPLPRACELVLAGAHGGAGTTTLAALLQPAWDLGAPRQAKGGFPRIRAAGRPVVLVARHTSAGAARAVTAVDAVARSGGRIAVLAIVSDGFPEPPAARYRFQLLEARVGAVVRVPFVAALRVGDGAGQVKLPRRAQRALAAIRDLAFAEPPPPFPHPYPAAAAGGAGAAPLWRQ